MISEPRGGFSSDSSEQELRTLQAMAYRRESTYQIIQLADRLLPRTRDVRTVQNILHRALRETIEQFRMRGEAIAPQFGNHGRAYFEDYLARLEREMGIAPASRPRETISRPVQSRPSPPSYSSSPSRRGRFEDVADAMIDDIAKQELEGAPRRYEE